MPQAEEQLLASCNRKCLRATQTATQPGDEYELAVDYTAGENTHNHRVGGQSAARISAPTIYAAFLATGVFNNSIALR